MSQFLEKDGQKYIQEGKALIQTKKVTVKDDKQIEEEVFYNPPQIINRDLTVLVIDTFSKGRPPLTILDALSASGLRSIRYSQEIANVKEIYANDLSTASLSIINENIALNGVTNVKVYNMDANILMRDKAFDVIDLDPYGSVIPFLDSAIDSCKDSLLCVTCTDSRVLCGPDQQKCFLQYGTARVKMNCFGENGLRTLLHSIAIACGRKGRSFQPLMSFYGEFYLRVFCHVRFDKKSSQSLISEIGTALVCTQCQSFYHHRFGEQQEKNYKTSKQKFPSECTVCGSPLRMNGPIWLGPMNDREFIIQMKDNLINHTQFQMMQQIQGKLDGILNQIEFESKPFAYNLAQMASYLKSSNLSKKEIYAGLQSQGFKVAQGYIQKDEFKTDAPNEAIFDLIKSWKMAKTGDNYFKNVDPTSVVHKILAAEVKYQPDFTFKETMQQAKMFHQNPPNWGPKSKAVAKRVLEIVEPEKKVKL